MSFDSLRPAGATNLYGALNLALDFQGRGLHDKYYELGFDTVYIMSDASAYHSADTFLIDGGYNTF